MRKFAIIIVIGLILYPFVSTIGFVVDQRQYAIVYADNEIKQVLKEPGLYFKMPAPMQNLVKFDKRLQTSEMNEPSPIATSEKKNVLVDAFVRWRIIDPKVYYESFKGGDPLAQQQVLEMTRLALNDEISKRTVTEVVSGERSKLLDGVLKQVRDKTKPLGIELVDVRIKRLDHVDSAPVYEQMKTDLVRAASARRAIGVAAAEKIRAEVDRQRSTILAEGYRDAQKMRGDGDAKASRLYAQAFGKNPEFARFYRSLEAYRASFSNRNDVLIVDPSSEFFRYMKNPKIAK